jgi:hypothetical protein
MGLAADLRLDEASALEEPRFMTNWRLRPLGALAVVATVAGGAGCGDSSCKCAGPQPYSGRAVAPDAQTALGFSANDVKASLAGPWVGTLFWVSDPTTVIAQPASGTTEVTVAVRYAFDERSIIAQEPSATYTDASAALLRMELPVHLLVTTADGALTEDLPATVWATSATRATVRTSLGVGPDTAVRGTLAATAVNSTRYLGTQMQMAVELAPEIVTGRLILLGLGTAKSEDGKSDVKIADELPLATFTATVVPASGVPDGGVGPEDAAVTSDGGCLPPKSIIYTTPGCGAEAIPRCEVPNGDGCSMSVCLCDGVTSSGDGCGFSHEPFLYVGWCKRDAAASADISIGVDWSTEAPPNVNGG